MKGTQSLLCCFLALSLAACVSMPKSPEDFRDKEVGKLNFAADLPLTDAYTLVAKNTIRCHQGNTTQMSMVASTFLVFPTGSTRVEGSMDSSAGKATITVHFSNPVANGLLQVIDFQAVSQNQTRVIVYRLNDTTKWKTATQSVQDWFHGGTGCYKMWGS